MRALALLVLLSLSACGGGNELNWAGTYTGALVSNISCSNGTSGADSYAARFVVTKSGTNLFLDDGSPCAIFTAAISGASAAVNPKVCPPYSNADGVNVDFTVDTGTVTLHGSSLAITFNESSVVEYTPQLSCTGTETGTFAIAQQ